MTPDDYATWIDWMEERWPGTRAYVKADRSFTDFAPYTAGHLETACRSLYAEGSKTAPSLSLIFAEVIAQARLSPSKDWAPRADYCLKEGHVWAIVELEYRSEDGLRHAICARCGRETAGDQETLPTVGEREHAAR